MAEFVVYVLYSDSSDRLYIGYSSNSVERFKWHNDLSKKGFTTKYRPWKMIHVEFFSDKSTAMLREKQLKGGLGYA
jgi:putative endonuclease